MLINKRLGTREQRAFQTCLFPKIVKLCTLPLIDNPGAQVGDGEICFFYVWPACGPNNGSAKENCRCEFGNCAFVESNIDRLAWASTRWGRCHWHKDSSRAGAEGQRPWSMAVIPPSTAAGLLRYADNLGGISSGSINQTQRSL